ncbi:hypothetical protein V495_05949, partial [Pseudogymnoascus sp. VKM F-4514 (FW-929)]
MRFLTFLLSAASLVSAAAVPGPPPPPGNSSYTNPILPGWHSDPSCTFVPTLSTTFCITSSFLSFPGLPLYSSRDLSTWTLASNVFSRPSQVPEFATLDTDADEGFWAATVRWHDGVLYVVVGYVDYDDAHHQMTTYLLFTSSDPFSSSSWSDGLIIANPQGTIDGIYSGMMTEQCTVSPVTKIWNGTGGSNPEGPHIYKKDGYYYLLIAEGGSGPNHMLVPSASNLSGNAAVDVKDGLTFVGRRQTATLFEFSVDVEFDARIEGEEAVITVFISQGQHLDLSIVAGQYETAPQLRFRAATFGKANATAVEERVVDIPKAWPNAPIRLLVEAKDDERYTFSASSTRGKSEVKEMGTGGADILTGGLGRFVGTLVGAYATNNNGNGTASAYLSRWRYTPIAQKIAEGV